MPTSRSVRTRRCGRRRIRVRRIGGGVPDGGRWPVRGGAGARSALPTGSFARTPEEMARNFWDPSEGRHGLFDIWTFKQYVVPLRHEQPFVNHIYPSPKSPSSNVNMNSPAA